MSDEESKQGIMDVLANALIEAYWKKQRT